MDHRGRRLRNAGDAVRWEWIGRNPFELAEPISAPHSEPKPPTAEQAAVISAEAWRDLDWGMMVWLYMTTGARQARCARCAGTDSTRRGHNHADLSARWPTSEETTARTSASPTSPTTPNHPALSLNCQRIRRRTILGGLISEYERTA